MKKRKGLQHKLWFYFTMFSCCILVVLWLLQIMYFNVYYETMKFAEVENIGKDFLEYYNSKNISEIPPQGTFRNGVILRVINKEGSFTDFGYHKDMRIRRERETIEKYIEKLNSSSKKYLIETVSNDGRGMGNNIVFIAEISDSKGESYLYLTAPLSPVDATVNVLKSQFILVSFLALIISFLLSFFMSNRLALPIVKIKNSALELAKGKYDVTFEDGNYNEINELSNVLNRTAKELSKNEELRRDLIANISHDLKTPLTIIKSYAEMVIDISGDNKEKRQEHLGVIINEADRLTLLVNDILDLSRMEAKTVEFEKENFDFSQTVNKIYEGFKVFSNYKNYNFSLECPNHVYAIGNEGRINQVIYNLIGNAINYTGDDKTVKIKVTENENSVRFAVTDTGKGIADDELERVWNRYYKASKTNTREVNGSGIGLAIVKNILELHNAEYGIISEIDKGSTFWFELLKGKA